MQEILRRVSAWMASLYPLRDIVELNAYLRQVNNPDRTFTGLVLNRPASTWLLLPGGAAVLQRILRLASSAPYDVLLRRVRPEFENCGTGAVGVLPELQTLLWIPACDSTGIRRGVRHKRSRGRNRSRALLQQTVRCWTAVKSVQRIGNHEKSGGSGGHHRR
jgi:hypothetical protein